MTHLHMKHPEKGNLGCVAQPSEAGSHKHPRCHGLYFTAEGMEAFSFERDLESGRRQQSWPSLNKPLSGTGWKSEGSSNPRWVHSGECSDEHESWLARNGSQEWEGVSEATPTTIGPQAGSWEAGECGSRQFVQLPDTQHPLSLNLPLSL